MKNKRICFISLGNLYLCPYISKYISLINCDYDIIYWDRHGLEENIGAKRVFSFKYNMNETKGKLSKIFGYLKFRKYSLEVIKKNNYDGIILLQTSIGVLLQKLLKRKYKDRYIVDIRDYTMENNPIFFSLVNKLIKNSAYTVISSRGYENFLPKYDYVLIHNDSKIDEDTIESFQNKQRKKNQIVISYIGLIRFHEQNKKAILKFKNNSSFILRFIGTDACSLKGFCENNNVNNVELIDRFPPEKTLEYYYDSDIIYNLYGNKSSLLDYALSNKLYYAAKLRIPIIVSPGTYMEQISTQYGFGYVFNIDDPNACNALLSYYSSINWVDFSFKCDEFIKTVERDNLVFSTTIHSFVQQI